MQFELLSVEADGGTRRDHLETAARSGSHAARAELEKAAEATPGCCGYLWGWFLELHVARASNGFGPAPISWEAIWCWAKLTGRKLEQFELSAIRAIDQVFIETIGKAELSRKQSK